PVGYDVAALRAGVPALASGTAFFDGPGGTQTPRAVAEAMAAVLSAPLSNRGRLHPAQRNAEDVVAAFREAGADLLGVPPTGVVHGRSATQLTFDLSRTLAREWQPGDEVVLTRLEHDANLQPWLLAAERTGARVRWLELDPVTAELDLSTLEQVLTERTRLVAVTGASNLLGTRPPLQRIAAAAHAVGALVWVDGVHLVPHELVDLPALGVDALVCSAYKFLGPHCGLLAATPELLERLAPDKLRPASDDVPERFELGTLPYEVLAGVTAAVDLLAELVPSRPTASRRERLRRSMRAVHASETALRVQLEDGLDALGERVVRHSRAAERTPTVLVSLPGRSAAEAARFLAERDVLAPAGTFYATEPARVLGLLDDPPLRVGLAPYTDAEDVARLLDGLRAFLR
ncbi:cysteine desulfurase-like protein, partial [Desertihabitans aurantiacus]|uniref:cysteine desulfurase-like protein n=1 Tax=Desertihabitans aurantiacus TaxID=2282477 RepID=UPI001E4D0649